MIEINLVPDVKQELLHAQRVRNSVMSVAILVGIISIGAVLLLALYVYGGQTVRSALADNSIKSEQSKLEKVDDLANALTIKHQVDSISEYHDKTNVYSRAFDVLSTVVPRGDNGVQVTNFSIDSENKTITIQASASGGYQALETLKKTILATKFEFHTKDDSSTQSEMLTDQISDGDRSYSQDADGKRTLNFSVTFAYPESLFSRTSIGGRIVGPSKTNATDSALAVPKSLFQTGEGN